MKSEDVNGEYYKIAKSDGWDFHTGKTINYRDNIGKIVKCQCPNEGKPKLCTNTVIHASEKVLDALRYAKLPCSIYRVEGKSVISDNNKVGFKELEIIEEIPESEFDELLGFKYSEVINPINPLEIDNDPCEEDWNNLREWASVKASVKASVGASVRGSVKDSVRDSVWDSVGDSVRASVRASVRGSVEDSVWDSFWVFVWNSVGNSVRAYMGSLFHITDWKYINHKQGKYPFQSGVDLWKRGFIPIKIDGKWKLWSKARGIIDGVVK
ncbi:MAG: hypothetical protein ACTSRU_09050 [Candidatus Hodarchaeales archaeon]